VKRVSKRTPEEICRLPARIQKLIWLALYLASKVEEYERYLRYHAPYPHIVNALEKYEKSFLHVSSIVEKAAAKEGYFIIIYR